MWGADSDFEGLMHQEIPIRLKVLPQAVVDVQLAFSSGERRLGMAKMLERLPKSFIERLPDKQQPLGFMTSVLWRFIAFSTAFCMLFDGFTYDLSLFSRISLYRSIVCSLV